MNLKRRQLLGGTALAAAWGTRGVGIGGAALVAPVSAAGLPESAPEKNKRLMREQRAMAQMHALPSALPGEGTFDRRTQTPLIGFAPETVWICNDSPRLPNATPADLERIQNGFASQALGPTFISYGPMLAEQDVVIEEWESQIYGANGTLYNNQYLSLMRFKDDRVHEFREYNDTQHAAIIFGPLGKWPELKPPTGPRRRGRKGVPAVPAADMETAFEVIDKFDLDPRLLADVVPSAAAPPVRVKPGIEGNKALVSGLRKAQATGNPSLVNSFYAKGFRHFISGEKPFGWDHLPRQEIYAPLVKHLASPLTVRYGPMIADETRVFEEMDSFARLDDGTVYNNWHAFIHEIRDGKIVQTREYHDPRHVWVVLGRWASWGATPVPPRSTPRRSNLQGIAATIQYPTTGGPDLERFRPFDPPPT